MKQNFNSKFFFSGILIILIALVFFPLFLIKADSGVSLYITPNKGNYKVGDLINASVMIDTKGETINALKATLTFNENLIVQNISKSDSIFGLWIEEPSYDNSSRTITFGGAGAGTTYQGPAGKIISITFKTKKAGQGTVNFLSTLVKYGGTTIEVANTSGGSYTIIPSCECSAWESKNCGEGNCSSGQRLQVRICTPSGCAVENRCKEDSSCKQKEIIEKPTSPEEKKLPEKEKLSEEKKIVEKPIEKEITFPQKEIPPTGFLASLAMAWKEISKSTFLTIVTIFCIIALILIGIKEIKLFRRKKSEK